MSSCLLGSVMMLLHPKRKLRSMPMRMSMIAASSWSEKLQPTSLLAIFMKVDCSTWVLKIWQ